MNCCQRCVDAVSRSIGDVMLDCYLHGPLERISPEAPVPVFEIGARNSSSAGQRMWHPACRRWELQVKLAGVVGQDEHGERLRHAARQLDIDSDATLVEPRRPTTCKTRVIARNQQILRLDRESRQPLSEAIERSLIDHIRTAVEWADAVILSDYAKGVLTPHVCGAAIRAANGKTVVVDPKKLPWDRYRGATILKPNRIEAEHFAQTRVDEDASAGKVALQIVTTLDVAHALLTRAQPA